MSVIRPPRRRLDRLVAAMIAPLGVCIASPATSGPATTTRPVSRDVYSGRWYEIARTPNSMQKDCQGPTTDFQDRANGTFAVVETCHRGSAQGPAKVIAAKARILSPTDNARFRLSYLGGLVHQDYLILDHAEDNAWLLMGTPGGNYVWLLSRRPALASGVLSAAVGRAGALGYPASRLIYPSQAGG